MQRSDLNTLFFTENIRFCFERAWSMQLILKRNRTKVGELFEKNSDSLPGG